MRDALYAPPQLISKNLTKAQNNAKVEHMNAKYIAIPDSPTRRPQQFDLAEQVAVFMLGKRFSNWSIYQRQDNLPTDVSKLQAFLEEKEEKE